MQQNTAIQLPLSRHARKRARQRGVTHGTVGLILDHYDRAVGVGDGCRALSLTSAALSRLPAADVRDAKAERASGVVVVESPDGLVITVLYPTRRAGRHYRRPIAEHRARVAPSKTRLGTSP